MSAHVDAMVWPHIPPHVTTHVWPAHVRAHVAAQVPFGGQVDKSHVFPATHVTGQVLAWVAVPPATVDKLESSRSRIVTFFNVRRVFIEESFLRLARSCICKLERGMIMSWSFLPSNAISNN